MDHTQIEQKKTWVTFTFHNHMIRKVDNLFENSNLHMAHSNPIAHKVCSKIKYKTNMITMAYTD